MGIRIVEKLSKEDVSVAREEFDTYIKITVDIKQGIVAIGGKYHADSEKVLSDEYSSKSSDIWGGGFDLLSKEFETNAILNIKPVQENPSNEILDENVRLQFLNIVKERLSGLESLI